MTLRGLDLVCPECEVPVEGDGGDLVCPRCGSRFSREAPVAQFLSERRRRELAPFVEQYRLVRARDGYRREEADYYRRLPDVPASDPDRDRWRLRRASFARLRQRVSADASGQSLRVLELGAGSAWLSARLAEDGHRAVALDILSDEADGLGAVRHQTAAIECVEADLDAPPFAPAQFDVVLFAASLHYSRDVVRALCRAWTLVRTGGVLAVVDSPCFVRAADGEAMVTERDRCFADRYGIGRPVVQGRGFVLLGELEEAAVRLGLRTRFDRSRGRLAWELRRRLDGLRARREPARFGVWWAWAPANG